MPTKRRELALRRLHESVIDLVTLINLPQRDDVILAEAGIKLDRALFPLLVGIQRYGPLGVVEIAERAGRDYSTVSRQLAKLAELGLVVRRPSPTDGRVKEAIVSDEGRRAVAAIDAARSRLALSAFAHWNDKDLLELEHLLRRFVDDMTTFPGFTE